MSDSQNFEAHDFGVIDAPSTRRPLRSKLTKTTAAITAAWIAIFGAVLTVGFIASSHSYVANSDSATVVLEGKAISAGNVMLHGWSLSLDSFWSVDAMFYAAAVFVGGLRPQLVHLVPAIIAAFTVVVGMAVACGRKKTLAGIAGALTVLFLIGVPGPDWTYFFTQGPWHVGTTLWCLIAFCFLANKRLGPWRVVGAVVFVVAGLLGDLIALSIGVVPVAIVGLLALLRRARRREGLLYFATAVLMLVAAGVARTIAAAIGTFVLANRNIPISNKQLSLNLHHLLPLVSGLFGVGDVPIGATNGPTVVRVFRVIALVLVACGVLQAIYGLIIRTFGRVKTTASLTSLLDDLLLVACLASLVTYVVGSPTGNANYVRYLIPSVVFGSILGGRFVGRVLTRFQGIGVRLSTALVGAVLLAFSCLGTACIITTAAPAIPTHDLGVFLEQHHLTRGIGDYWSSSIVTVNTDGKVVIRPVTNTPQGKLIRYERQSETSWYANQTFQFFVYDTGRPWRMVNLTTAVATYGQPVKTYAVGTYRVLVWKAPIPVSTQLSLPSNPLRLLFRP